MRVICCYIISFISFLNFYRDNWKEHGLRYDKQLRSRIYRSLSHINTENYSRLKDGDQSGEYKVCYTLYFFKDSESEKREILEQVSKLYYFIFD